MTKLELLRNEIKSIDARGLSSVENLLQFHGLQKHYRDTPITAKAYAKAELFGNMRKHVYENDVILGSMLGLFERDVNPALLQSADAITENFGKNRFHTNLDHFTPDYEYVLSRGIGGMLEDIERSLKEHSSDADKKEFLNCCRICMEGLSEFISGFADAAERMGKTEEAQCCRNVALKPPKTFREALQLVWLVLMSFICEGRFAVALGRIDQYLYPFYKRDGITREEATELLACVFIKIGEKKQILGGSDVINICIGGVKRDGSVAVNDLTFCVLEAVKQCGIPGPNLSARLQYDSDDEYFDKCLDVIRTGIGYPALMNDTVDIASLARYGYDIEDCRDYSMVGCIENFLTGKQPPWSDGRFNTPKYLEYALNEGCCMQTGARLGLHTKPAENISSMDDFMEVFKAQLSLGADEYACLTNNLSDSVNPRMFSQPYLSCFFPTCIQRGLDIRSGGTQYPSNHGVALMGIATVADSLAAVEQVVFCDKAVTLAQLRDALLADFVGYEPLRAKLLNAPKYGNNNELPDKYAKWFTKYFYELFKDKRTRDGGNFFMGIASNVQNNSAGKLVAATPDGRKNGEALSDAASPMHGMDKRGLTSALHSVSKPDYTYCACGTVVNIKLAETMMSNKAKRDKLKNAIRVYFKNGAQEIQINCVSRRVLLDANEHPEEYSDLVVRVSGFSAYYNELQDDVKRDILARTEYE